MAAFKQFSQQLLSAALPKLTKRKQSADDKKSVHSPSILSTPLTPDCHQNTILEQIPFEIVRIIISKLLPEERVAFSLVSKFLWTSCGNEHKSHLTRGSPQKRSFLLLLEHDLPDYVSCYTCVKLYRWRVAGDKVPRLCPGRKLRPHYSYGHLDIQHHQRRVEREIFDLICRGADNPDYGLPTSFLLEILREKDKFDRRLTIPLASQPSLISYYDSTLVVKTQTEVRIPWRRKYKPTATDCVWELSNALAPSDLRHGTLSSMLRWFGGSLHEVYQHSYLSKGADHEFYLCLNCHSSIRIAWRSFLRWAVLKVDTAQCFGSTHELIGAEDRIAGIRRHHRKIMPNVLVQVMTCSQTDENRQPFVVQPTGEYFRGPVDPRDHDLSVFAWLSRHQSSYQQRLWPAGSEGEWGEFEDVRTEQDPVIGPNGVCDWPMMSNDVLEEYLDEWEDSNMPLRKRWLNTMYYNTKDGVARLFSKVGNNRDSDDDDDEDEGE